MLVYNSLLNRWTRPIDDEVKLQYWTVCYDRQQVTTRQHHADEIV